MRPRTVCLLVAAAVAVAAVAVAAAPAAAATRSYPVHSRIVLTSFWVGEIFDPTASDGSQMISTYDDGWYARYGGCDGVVRGTGTKACQTERRTAPNFWPTAMTPKENPFYLDLPFDDLNNGAAYRARASVVPWANDPGFAGHATDQRFSYMKNRWVQLSRGGQVCYGQIEDAGPGVYNDQSYVFGALDARPTNRRYGGAGADVSPALTGCLSLPDLDGISPADTTWQFVEASAVPAGPWTRIVTTSQVNGATPSADYVAAITPTGVPTPTTVSTTATSSQSVPATTTTTTTTGCR